MFIESFYPIAFNYGYVTSARRNLQANVHPDARIEERCPLLMIEARSRRRRGPCLRARNKDQSWLTGHERTTTSGSCTVGRYFLSLSKSEQGVVASFGEETTVWSPHPRETCKSINRVILRLNGHF